MRNDPKSYLSKQDRLERIKPSLLEAEERSKKWLNQRKMNSQKRNNLRTRILGDAKNRFSRVILGNMYMYEYDPLDRSKREMPYYDTFPLVIVFQIYAGGKNGNGFYGLNLHYLPPRVRADVLDVLRTNKKGEMIPLVNKIKELAKFDVFKPAIHLYLYKNTISDLVMILPEEWENVINLPLARWKAGEGGKTKGTTRPSQNKVNADYRRKVG